jgi:hypothetical protein
VDPSRTGDGSAARRFLDRVDGDDAQWSIGMFALLDLRWFPQVSRLIDCMSRAVAGRLMRGALNCL